MANTIQNQTMQEVQTILQDMVAHLLITKPEEPVPYIIQFLQDSQKQGAAPLTKDERIELDNLREEHARLKEKKANQEEKEQSDSGSEGEEADSKPKARRAAVSSSDSDCGDEYGDELGALAGPVDVKKQKEMSSTKRTSVSAEVFGKFNVQQAFKAKVVSKTDAEKESIKKRLQGAFMFMSLDDADLNTVIDAISAKKFGADETVIQEGENGEVLYIVESGKLSCHKIIGGSDKFLKNFEAGDVFGELALLYNAPRAATIKSLEDSHLWVLDRATFNNIVKVASQKKREKYENFLQTVPILQNMDHYERSKMADAVKEKKFESGETIIKQGDAGDVFFILVEGSAKATLDSDPSNSVMKYKSGDYFGELALLRGEPRAANVITEEATKCIFLDRKAFTRLLGPLDTILQRNMANYSNYH